MVQETIIKNEFDHSYLFVKVESLKMDSYPFLMITQNNIPGLLNCRLRYIEDVAYYSYEISSKRSLEQEYNGRKIHFEDLKEIFYNIYIILKKAAEFLLDKDGFLLEPSYIFRDLETEELYCVYLPERILQSNKPDNYRELADFLLDKTDHKDEHAVNCVYQFYKMSKEEFFSFEAFWSFLEKEELMLQAEHKRMEEKRKAGNILEKPIEFEPESVMKQDAKNVAVEEEKSKLNWWIPGISAGIGLFLLLYPVFVRQNQPHAGKEFIVFQAIEAQKSGPVGAGMPFEEGIRVLPRQYRPDPLLTNFPIEDDPFPFLQWGVLAS